MPKFKYIEKRILKLVYKFVIVSKGGRYGGTFAHSNIAFEFASWISPEFKLYIIKDYQRLKADESHAKAIDWSVKREIAKSNYRLHTDAIKEAMAPILPLSKSLTPMLQKQT